MQRETIRKYLIGEISLRRLGRSLLVIYLCIALFAWVWSDRMIFQPQPPTYKDPSWVVRIPSKNGTPLSTVYLPHTNATYTILYNHANAVDIGEILFFLELYREVGFSVFSYDYPGYGTSPGRPTSANACDAADYAFRHLTNNQGITPDKIIIHGRSVGGGPAIYLAHKYPVAGLIAESSFVSAFRVMTHVPLLPFDKFRNLSRIGRVACPVLVIHGTDDQTIPLWHGEALYAKAKEPKHSCWLPETTHNSMPLEAETRYWRAIASFADSLDN